MQKKKKKRRYVLYCAVSVKSKNFFYIINLFRKCRWSTSIYKSSDTCLKNVRLGLQCSNPCCDFNSHLLTCADTWKDGDKNASHQAQITRECLWVSSFAEPRHYKVLLLKTFNYTMVVVFQPEPRVYPIICFLVLVPGKDCFTDVSSSGS